MKLTHSQTDENLFAFSISFSRAYGMIGLDVFTHSINFVLYKNVGK